MCLRLAEYVGKTGVHRFVLFAALVLAALVLPVRAETTTSLTVSPSPCPMNALLTISGTTSANINVIVSIQGTTFADVTRSDGGGNWETSVIWTWSQGFYPVTAKPDVPDGVMNSVTVEGGVTIVTTVSTSTLYTTATALVTTVTRTVATVISTNTIHRFTSTGTATTTQTIQSLIPVTATTALLVSSTSIVTSVATLVATPTVTMTETMTSTSTTTVRPPPVDWLPYIIIIIVIILILLLLWYLMRWRRRRR